VGKSGRNLWGKDDEPGEKHEREEGANKEREEQKPMARAPRLSHEVRQEQIIDAALELVARYGTRGATLSRIAAKVGVTTPAMYAHFRNRKEILRTAVETLFVRRIRPHLKPSDGPALERLRSIEAGHSPLLGCKDDDCSLHALFEFTAASPQEGLRDVVVKNHRLLIESIINLLRQGQAEGTVRKDIDLVQTAWMIVGRGWMENMAYVMGLSDEWNRERSLRMLDFILESVATEEGRAALARASSLDTSMPPLGLE